MQVSLYKRETITETTKLPSSKALQVAKPQGPIYVTNVSVTSSGMHGRGPKAGAPASNAAGRGGDAADRASVPRRTALCHVASPESGRRGPTRLKSTPIRRKSDPMRPKSGRLGRIGRICLYRPKWPVSAETAESGRNSKKKK